MLRLTKTSSREYFHLHVLRRGFQPCQLEEVSIHFQIEVHQVLREFVAGGAPVVYGSYTDKPHLYQRLIVATITLGVHRDDCIIDRIVLYQRHWSCVGRKDVNGFSRLVDVVHKDLRSDAVADDYFRIDISRLDYPLKTARPEAESEHQHEVVIENIEDLDRRIC